MGLYCILVYIHTVVRVGNSFRFERIASIRSVEEDSRSDDGTVAFPAPVQVDAGFFIRNVRLGRREWRRRRRFKIRVDFFVFFQQLFPIEFVRDSNLVGHIDQIVQGLPFFRLAQHGVSCNEGLVLEFVQELDFRFLSFRLTVVRKIPALVLLAVIRAGS